MKHLKIAGLCLASMLTMGMALAENASAAPLWLLCLEGTGLTKYSSNQCTTAESGGKWQSLGIASGVTQTVQLLGFSLRIEDTGAGVTIRCPHIGITPGTGAGYIEGPNKGGVTLAETKEPEKEGCKVEGSLLTCKAGKFEKMRAVHLPWKTEISETEAKVFSEITSSTGGGPGWEITCGGVTDTCVNEGVAEEALLENVVSKGVLLVFGTSEGRAKQNCSVGGREKGLVAGMGALFLPNEDGLSINKA